ncbi:MAG: succinate dehydrogenase cytochrome b subunit [Planctomycetes bacterium]|nr:succinate dehydrogenase cytochrome b subunit [Planctomycetota bacterium]
MTKLLSRLTGSSLGKKFVMGLTGLMLVGFLFVHLGGNGLLYADRDGRAFDHYEQAMSANPAILLAEIGLAALFAAHIVFALRVTMANHVAKGEGYRRATPARTRTLGSSTMIYTGLVLLGFLIVHILDFRVGKLLRDDGYSMTAMVAERLASPVGAVVYLLGVSALLLHLSHGARSLFQSLGIGHPNLDPWLVRLGWTITLVLGLGFLSFPIYFLVQGAAR